MEEKLLIAVFLSFLFLIPIVKADGMPIPPVKPYLKEEHQIVFVEFKDQSIRTTLDLGIKNKPSNLFPILDNYVYLSSSSPFWIKTFLLPSNFEVKNLCIEGSSYYTQAITIEINGNLVYLPIPISKYYEDTYCSFSLSPNFTHPVDVSQYFISGSYNTIKISSSSYFSIRKVYLTSSEKISEKVRIIIPFKIFPKYIEVSSYEGLNIWDLDRPFGYRKWYGYFGNTILSQETSPSLASIAVGVESRAKESISSLSVSEASANFQGKVSDLLATTSAKGYYEIEGSLIKLEGIDVSYKPYLQDNAYVIDLNIKPFETKRIVIKWESGIGDINNFQYYYPLGTSKTWSENITYIAIYVKLPKSYIISYSNLEGSEKAEYKEYNYYRWKFVESNPEKDLYLNIRKISEIEKFIHELIEKYSGILVCIIFLISVGIFIQYKSKILKRVRKWI